MHAQGSWLACMLHPQTAGLVAALVCKSGIAACDHILLVIAVLVASAFCKYLPHCCRMRVHGCGAGRQAPLARQLPSLMVDCMTALFYTDKKFITQQQHAFQARLGVEPNEQFPACVPSGACPAEDSISIMQSLHPGPVEMMILAR